MSWFYCQAPLNFQCLQLKVEFWEIIVNFNALTNNSGEGDETSHQTTHDVTMAISNHCKEDK